MTLILRDVIFSWNKEEDPLLLIPNLSLASGEKVLLKGPSGSGKSTILALVAGVLVPRSGAIALLSQELNEMSAAQRDQFRADHMGFIFQMFNLLPYLSVLENVLLPLQFSKHKRKKMLHMHLNPQKEALRLLNDLGMSALINKNVTELSVGQQQRVAVARALLGSPELIIADEPTSALDSDTRVAFLELLFRECKRTHASLLYVSHDSGLEGLFDRVEEMSKFVPQVVEESRV